MNWISIAVLAGGKSSRMGSNKAFVALQGQPLIEHVLNRAARCQPNETFIVTNTSQDYAYLGLPTVGDVVPGCGSLGGIYSAISHSRSFYTLVIACDMPFISPELIRHMAGYCAKHAYDVIVPRVDGHPQGLFAIYSKRCTASIRRKLAEKQLKVISFYNAVSVLYLDEPEYRAYINHVNPFWNINTPDQLAEARVLAQAHNDIQCDESTAPSHDR